MIKWLHAPILPNTLGVILEEIILHKAGGVSLIVLEDQRLGSTSSSHDTDQRSTGKASRLNPHVTVRKQDDIELTQQSDASEHFYADVTIVQQESDLKSAPRVNIGQI